MNTLLKIFAAACLLLAPLIGRSLTFTTGNYGGLAFDVMWSSFATVGDDKHIVVTVHDSNNEWIGSASILVENVGGYSRVKVESIDCIGDESFSNSSAEYASFSFSGFSTSGNLLYIDVETDYAVDQQTGSAAGHSYDWSNAADITYEANAFYP